MAINAHYDKDNLNYVQVIKNAAPLAETRLRASLKDMIAALDAINERIDDQNYYYFGIDPSGTWSRDKGAFEASSEIIMRFWADVANRAELLSDAKAWLVALEAFLKSSDRARYEGIWEDDEMQLGELGASVLAMHHIKFVPYYTKLLRVWDLDHEVNQSDAIQQIVRTHGICRETEELLFVRSVEAPGQTGHGDLEELADLFEAKYGTLDKAPLVQMIATALHNDDYDYRTNDWEKFKAGEIAQPTNFADRDLFNSWCYPKLHAAAQPIIAKLDAAVGPMPWLEHER